MALWLALLLAILFQFAMTYILVWAISGAPTLFGGKRLLRGTGLLIVAGLLTVPTGFREIRSYNQRAVDQNSVLIEVQRLNEIFTHAIGSMTSRGAVRSAVAELSPAQWDSDALAMVVTAAQLKAERYNDILQSSLLSRVIRTDLPWDPRIASQMTATDERAWTPLLEAAARQEAVNLPDGVVNPGDEMAALAWSASRALGVVLGSIEEVHGVAVPLSDAARELTPALEWLADMANATPETQASLGEELNQVGWVVYGSSRQASIPLDTLVLESSHPETVRSFLLHMWAQLYVATYSERWVALAGMAQADAANLTRVNAYRRFLGFPIILESDIEMVRREGLLPFWSNQPSGMLLSDYLADLNDELEALTEQFAPMSSALSLAATVSR